MNNSHSNKKSNNRPQYIKSKNPESLQSTEMKFHPNSADQSQQEIILKNISTPSKQSLKQNILERLSGSKNKSFQKKLTETLDFDSNENQQNQLKQQIIKHQNESNDGFYLYQNWLNINQVLFNKNDTYVQELWKILRMINFGEISIPTGLVYEILSIIKAKNSTKAKYDKMIGQINRFLEFNEIKTTTFRNFKELKNYKPLEEILNSYAGEKIEIEKPKASKKQNSAIFDNLYNEAKQRSEKQSMMSILNQKEELTQCTFTPFISNYTSSEKSRNNTHRQSRCNSNHKILLQQNNYVPFNIKPLPFDPKWFKKDIEQIKGASDHILRNMASYQQKLRIKRMLQKPVILKYK